MIHTHDSRSLFESFASPLRLHLASPWTYAFIFFFAVAITQMEAEVAGAIIFVYIISVYLIIFDDLISAMLPFLLLCTFTIKCYDSFDTFLPYFGHIIPAALAVTFHFIYYRKRISIGDSFLGICAVAVAVTLGGLFSISAEDYLRPTSLYHVFALGIGMIIAYILFRSSLGGRSIKESSDRFAVFMYLWGAFAAYMVISFAIFNLDILSESGEMPYIQWSNNVATMLMITMPFPFYFALKNPIHLASGYLFYVATLLSTSRGGILFGTLEMIIITVYVIIATKKRSTRICVVSISALAAAVTYKNLLGVADILNLSILADPNSLISTKEARVVLFGRSLKDFRSNVWFGRGLGYSGNSDVYSPKKGALHFYHMMIPQIIGSMGLCGIGGYLYQLIFRIRTVARRITPYTICLFISYIGLFMMTQVNPGEFVPIPYALIAVLTFIIIENQPTTAK